MEIAAILQITLLTNAIGGQGSLTMPDGSIVRSDGYTVHMQAACNHQMGNFRLRFVAVGDVPFTNFTVVTRVPPVGVITNPTPIPPPVVFPANIATEILPGALPIPPPVAATAKPTTTPSAPVLNVPPPPTPLPPLPARPVP